MKIGITGPISVDILSKYVENGDNLPPTHGSHLIGYIAELLLEKGHTVSVFALSNCIKEPMVFKGDKLTIHIGRYRLHARHYLRDIYLKERRDLTAAMKKDPCDIIHAHWTYEFALAALASGQSTLISAHDAPFKVLRYVKPFYLRFIHLLIAFYVCRKAKYLTAVSPYLIEHYRNLMLYRQPIELIPNGMPDKIFDMYKSQNNKANSILTFATIAQGWQIRKNGTAALQAFAIFRREMPNSRLLMFGQDHGPQEKVAQWAIKNGLEKGVEFIGALPHIELIEYLSREVNVLINPSMEESFGLVLIEAMALGIPVIGGIKSGGVPYVLGYGKVGMLVDVRSPKAICNAMLELARDKQAMIDLGEKGRKYASEHYRLSDVVDKYIKMYTMILRNKI